MAGLRDRLSWDCSAVDDTLHLSVEWRFPPPCRLRCGWYPGDDKIAGDSDSHHFDLRLARSAHESCTKLVPRRLTERTTMLDCYAGSFVRHSDSGLATVHRVLLYRACVAGWGWSQAQQRARQRDGPRSCRGNYPIWRGANRDPHRQPRRAIDGAWTADGQMTASGIYRMS